MTASLLAATGPAALAFWAGGYFEGPRLAAAIVAWALVAFLALVAPTPPRPSAPTLAAVGGLVLLVAWVASSRSHAPLEDPAGADLQRDALYLGTLLVALLVVRDAATLRALEPAFAIAITVVAGYGLAGQVLPGLVEQHHGASAGGRLDQPLTYWNAMGALAAIGLVLCARLAGDPRRGARTRALAAAAAAPLGLAVYLTFSRGALGALAAGAVVLLALAPTWEQLRAAAVAAEAGALAAIVVGTAHGALPVLALLLVMAGAGALQAWSAGAARTGPLPLPRWGRAAAWALAAAVAAAPYAVAVASERGTPSSPAFGATTQRLGSVGSNRYAYWRVAVDTWADHPVVGAGPASFRAEWLARRPFAETVRDAHSLELETLAELGLVGLGCLTLLIGGVVAAVWQLAARDAALVAGPAAALAVWFVHAGVDWDWEMPALTLVAVVLAGGVLGAAQARPREG